MNTWACCFPLWVWASLTTPLKLSLGQVVHKDFHSLAKTLVRTTSFAGNFDRIVHNISLSKRRGKNIF
uniref:Secreted protein n=1 Tax=Triticum urartu TaxID=4572 RepID=A0A8R7QPI2_TRIUA